MPSLHGLTVHVTDKEGNELKEWGIQQIRHHANGRMTGAKVSAYIQSTTDLQFMVSVQPRIPFINADYPDSNLDVNIVNAGKGSSCDRHSKHHGQPNSRRRSDRDDTPKGHNHGIGNADASLVLSSPVRQSQTCNEHPDYSLLASLYLDGRSEPERRIIVYLDPRDIDFNPPDGKVKFKNRWVRAKDGAMTELAWVFKEKAIETVFDRLMINASQARAEGRDIDTVIEAMQSSGIDREDEASSAISRVGQIVVQIKRVVLGVKRYQHKYRPKHQEGEDEDIDMEGLKPEITHATKLSRTGTFTSPSIRVVDYWSYKPDEGPWATFQFFYRSAEQLQRFGFEGFPVAVKPPKTRRSLTARMVSFPPLSIKNDISSKSRKSKAGLSYEEKVKRKAFKSGYDEPKLDFGFGYRDGSADNNYEAEEAYKFPAAPPPSVSPKTPPLLPQRDVSISGLVPLDSEGAASVMSTVKTALAGSITPYNADSLHQPSIPSVTTAFYIPKPDSHCRPKPYPDLGEASKGGTSEKSSPFPNGKDSSISDLSKENIAKLDNLSKNGYRLTSLKHVQNSDREEDDEEDGEPNTESDLETHGGDEDFEYTANVEEDDDDRVEQENLRSRLQKVVIGKRTYAEVEDAGDEEDDKKEGGTDAVAGAVDDGQGQEDEIQLLLTAGEEGEVRQDKRARIGDAVDG